MNWQFFIFPETRMVVKFEKIGTEISELLPSWTNNMCFGNFSIILFIDVNNDFT